MPEVGGFWLHLNSDCDHVVVALGGELDVATAPQLRDSLSEVVNGEDGRAVVVDLTQLTFIDSSGLNVLAQAMANLRQRQGNLVITNAQPSVHRVLEICGLTTVTEVGRAQPDSQAAAG